MRKRMIIGLVMAAFLSGSTTATESSVSPEFMQHVRASYIFSEETPMYLLFESYVQTLHNYVELEKFEGLNYVVDSLGFGHTQTGEAHAARVVGILADTYTKMNEENLRARKHLLCSSEAYQRDDWEIYEALNAIDDVSAGIAKKYYHLALSRLDSDARDRLNVRLDENRTGFYYLSFDHQSLMESLSVSASEHIRQLCQDLGKAKRYTN